MVNSFSMCSLNCAVLFDGQQVLNILIEILIVVDIHIEAVVLVLSLANIR